LRVAQRKIYINYQDTEYEKVFVKCGTNDIWSLSRGDNVVQQKLQELYTSEETYLNTYGEMLVTLSGRFEKYDLELYPNSHLKGDFLVNEFVYQDNNPEKVSGCKLKGKAANKRPIK